MGLCVSTNASFQRHTSNTPQSCGIQSVDQDDELPTADFQRALQEKLPPCVSSDSDGETNRKEVNLPSESHLISSDARESSLSETCSVNVNANAKRQIIYDADAYAFSAADVPLSKTFRHEGIPRVVVSLFSETHIEEPTKTKDVLHTDGVPRAHISLCSSMKAVAPVAIETKSEMIVMTSPLNIPRVSFSLNELFED